MLERKAVSGIMVTLLFLSVLTLACHVQPVKAIDTIYIRADGSIEPSMTSIMTFDNITYAFTSDIMNSQIMVERSDITIDGKGHSLQGDYNAGCGFLLSSVKNVTIRDTNINGGSIASPCPNGIAISQGNTISGNNVTDLGSVAINLSCSSNNIVSRNNITTIGTDNYFVGVLLAGSDNTVVGNRITGNGMGAIGIELENSNDNYIDRNVIKNNEDGLSLWESSNNIVTENNIENNLYVGLRTTGGNRIFHNNFINNTQQVLAFNSSVWDNGCEGNYWSDYNGTDTSIPRDGVGNTYLPWQGVDKYPLMNPFKRGDVNHDGSVDILDLITVAKALGTHQGDKKYNPHADLNTDGNIDILDLVLVCLYLGT
jgi:parallel beta-helix repeat protein